MKMTKTKKIMAGMGGSALVVVCVAGYMAISALMEKGEIDESLEMSESSYRRFAKAKIAPTAASAAEITSNAVVLSDWYEVTRREVAAGDVPVSSNVNEAAFKQKMVDDARALSKLPGAVVPEEGGAGTLVKAGFPFGFGRYITGGDLPAKETLAALQREWSDIMLFAEVFARCGVDELAKLDVLSAAQAQRPEEAVVVPARPAQRGRKAAPEEEKLCDEERYSVEIVVRPAALVKVLNALAACPRFVSVESLEFFRQTDMIADALSGSGDKGEKASSSSSGKRASARKKKKQQEEESAAFGEEGEAAAKKTGFVTEPKKEAPFTARMVLATCDFGTGGEAAAKAGAEPAEGDAAKDGDAAKEEVKQ